ncbi:MAG: DUF3786 domain-containing protein [Armatimonadota bacterium]
MADLGANPTQPTGQPAQARHQKTQLYSYEQAFELGFASLTSRWPSDEFLEALGAERRGNVIRLPALDRLLVIDRDLRQVSVEGSGRARLAWAILALHYLCAEDVSLDTYEVSLAHFPDCRGYLSVFNNRIIRRFLATSGRDDQVFSQRAETIGGVRLHSPGSKTECEVPRGLGYRFDVFPRVPITIIRYAGDDELDPWASVVYRADAQHLLPAEDRIVAAELVLDALHGKPMEQEPDIDNRANGSRDPSLHLG